MLSEKEKDFFKRHRAGLALAVAFAIIGVLLMMFGFLKTLFIIVLAVFGFFAGYVIDDKEIIRRFLNNYLGK